MTHPFLSYSGYGLVPALPNPCSFLGFSSCSLVSNFLFRFVVVHSSQIYLVWLYDHHLRGVFSLLPIGRHLCSFARILGYKPRCFGLPRRQTFPRHPPRFTAFSILSPRYSWSLVLIYSPIIMGAQPWTYSLWLIWSICYWAHSARSPLLAVSFFVSSTYSPSSTKLVIFFCGNFKFHQISSNFAQISNF